MAKKNLSKTTEVATKKTTKKVAEKTFKGTDIPHFDVILRPEETTSGLLLWGIGQTSDITILTHLNDEQNGVNRKVKQPHKSVVGNTMMQNGYACGIAVCIFNGKLYRVDGNHRAEFLADNGHLIRFSFRYVTTFQELVNVMIGFNNSAKNWGIDDYINTHSSMGIKSYILLKEQMAMHKLTSSVTASLIANASIGLVKKQIRTGELTFDNETNAKSRVLLAKNFLDAINNTDQRAGEGLLYFLGAINFIEFKSIKKEFVEVTLEVIKQGGLISKNDVPSARDFERVFHSAYKILTSKK
jgi:hypothetical protein